MLTTYALVGEFASVPCMDMSAAIQGRRLMLKFPEINQLDLLEEQYRERTALQSSCSPSEHATKSAGKEKEDCQRGS